MAFRVNKKDADSNLGLSERLKLFRSEYATAMIKLPIDNQPSRFSFRGREYLLPIYDGDNQRTLLMCGRQVEKCVVEDTQVLLADNTTKKIQDVVIGDKVIGVHMDASTHVATCVETFIPRHKACVRIRTMRGRSIDTSTDHPMRMYGKWVKAGSLRRYDSLIMYDGGVSFDTVDSVEPIGVKTCYDIGVSDIYGSHSFIANGFVTHNSTTLANMCLINSFMRQYFKTLVVTPTEQQTEVFSRDKIQIPLHASPDLAPYMTGELVKKNVFLRQFVNGSKIEFRSCYVSADRVRGISADMVLIDELQDINHAIIPIIEQTMSHSPHRIQFYSGTPKTVDNTISYYWENFSTKNEFMIPCDSCGMKKLGTRCWNSIEERNIGLEYMICSRCGAQIYAAHPDARWVRTGSPKTDIPYEGYRIPQPITSWVRWPEIVESKTRYPRAKFLNEVLGIAADEGQKPLVLETLRAQSLDSIRMADVEQYKSHGLYFGIDWGTGERTYTVISIGTYVQGVFTYLYYKRLEGSETDPQEQIRIISNLIDRLDPIMVATDYGGGYDRNSLLVKKYGSTKIQSFQYVEQKAKLTYDTERHRWMVDKSSVLYDFINAINLKTNFRFPRWEEFHEPFATDMVAIMLERNEERNKTWLVTTPGRTDDALDASLYAFLASTIRGNPRYDIFSPHGE